MRPRFLWLYNVLCTCEEGHVAAAGGDEAEAVVLNGAQEARVRVLLRRGQRRAPRVYLTRICTMSECCTQRGTVTDAV